MRVDWVSVVTWGSITIIVTLFWGVLGILLEPWNWLR